MASWRRTGSGTTNPLDLLVIVRSVWRLCAPWGRPDDHVVIDAPADHHQRNQDQDDVWHLNACDHGHDEPNPRHDGEHTEDLLTSPSHGLGLPKNDAATREVARGPPPATCRPTSPAASGPPRSRSGVGESAVCRCAGTSSTTEVLLWTIRCMAVGLGIVLVLLGIAMLVNSERIDAWQQRRFPRRPITPTRWQARRSSCSEEGFSLARVINRA